MTQASAQIANAFRHCREVTRRSARNFYYGMQLTPEPRRAYMFAVYAWMRLVDDMCDDSDWRNPEARIRLLQMRDITLAVLQGGAFEGGIGEPQMWIALRETAARCQLEPLDFTEMIEGQLEDLPPRCLQDWEELRRLCWRMASTVGRICVRVWGYKGEGALEFAALRGYGFQLTNILRDFTEDFDRGRVYLPAEDFSSAGLTPLELRRWSRPVECEAFMRSQIGRARGFYAQSAPLEGMVSADCRSTLQAMSEIYQGLLEMIATDPSAVMRGRVSLPGHRKLAIAWRASMRAGG